MYRKKRIILSCERGWRGIREFSLFLADNNLEVSVLIKGFPERQVRRMITSYSRIHNIFIPKRSYSIYLFIYLLFNLILHRVYFFISTSKRVKKGPIRFFKLEPFFIFERPNSYCIQDIQGKEIEPAIILETVSV